MVVEHPLLVQQRVPVMWKLADLDLMALANKYWIHGMSYEQIGRTFDLKTNTARRKIIQIRVQAKDGIEPWSSFLKRRPKNESS